MGSLFGDAYRQEGFKTIAGLARSRTMRTPVNAYRLVAHDRLLGMTVWCFGLHTFLLCLLS